MKKKILNWFILSLFITLIASCGPVTKAYIRSTFDEVEKGQNRVSKNDVTITAKALVGDLKDSVPSFFVSYTTKDNSGNVENNRSNIFMDKDLMVFEAQIENQTKHVLRMSGTVVNLIDPTSNTHSPLTQEDIISFWTGYAGASEVARQVRSIKFINSNMEILPGYSTKGYLVFRKDFTETPGVYKLALFDLTTKVDNIGNPTEKTAFEFRYAVKKFKDTFEEDILSGSKKLLSSEEIQ